ncbi:hypothetical protein R1flu_013618 [Riccia fluitans]|uniref:Uncharacterized protein n=1 Tax=Riccia fluitans TaxID=41844 RepID=A0ABD1YGX9_9MARC
MGRVGKILAGATIVTGVALLATPLAIPAVVSSLGFGPAGIAAGFLAASFMASYGGTVGAGSVCAILQSIGAVGTFTGATAVATAGAGITGVGVAAAVA